MNERPTSPPSGALFRPEVLAEQQTQWLGTVLLAPRIPHALFAGFAVLAAAGILGLLFFAEYTSKARVDGWLVPEAGLIRILAPQPGTVAQLYVQEGAEVAEGAPLVLLSTELQSEALGATWGEIVSRLLDRRNSMAAERDRQEQLHTAQVVALSGRLATIQAEQEHLERELELQRDRLALAERTTARQRQLRERGIGTEQDLQRAEADELDQGLRLQGLERDRIRIQRERLTLEAELQELPLRHAIQLAEIDRSVAALEQELAEAETRRELLLTAPQGGTVTAIQVAPGGSAGTTLPLLSIVPAGSDLEAQLFSPSRAVGFVRPGQRVLLRYEAYPYQKFGTYEGRVASVSRSAINPAELPQQMAGLTGLYGTDEPVYRITVALASQTATAYGEPTPLQPGMRLEADVLLERRRLIEWVFDPLFTLTGR